MAGRQARRGLSVLLTIRASRHRYPTQHPRDAVLRPGPVALWGWAKGHTASSVCPVPCLPPVTDCSALPRLSVLCKALWVNPPATASAEGRLIKGGLSSPRPLNFSLVPADTVCQERASTKTPHTIGLRRVPWGPSSGDDFVCDWKGKQAMLYLPPELALASEETTI